MNNWKKYKVSGDNSDLADNRTLSEKSSLSPEKPNKTK